MAIYGTSFQDAGTQASYNTGVLSVNSVSFTNVVTVNNLDAGTYIAHFCITPSTDSGPYPNGDPDGWYMRINKSGSVICDEQYFEEGGSTSTNQNSGSLTATFQSNGSDDIYFQARTTDGDGGGVGGRYSCHCFAIMRQS